MCVSFSLAMLGASGYVLPVEGWLIGFYSPFTRAWEFAVGALLALAGERARDRFPSWGGCVGRTRRRDAGQRPCC